MESKDTAEELLNSLSSDHETDMFSVT